MCVELGDRATSFMEKVRQKGDLLGLESVQNLFNELGNPQDGLSAIQVVGTNGKGSVCCFLSAILKEAGFRVGTFTSPQVFSYEERFVVDGEPITVLEMDAVLTEIEAAYSRLEEKGKVLPTVFEVEVAMAVLFFLRRKCDLVIMEAGMGGDLDATNVFVHPLLAVFTAIGLDHTQFLGETVEEIAEHKAGILKAGELAVSCWQDGMVERVLRECVEETLFIADKAKLRIESYKPLTFSYGNWQHITLGMQGDYQIENAVVTLLAIEALRELGYAISDEAVRTGLLVAHWRGRMERLDAEQTEWLQTNQQDTEQIGQRERSEQREQRMPTKLAIYLDGAHNPPAARALAETLERQFAGKKITFIIGMLADKAYREVLSILLPLATHMIAVTSPSDRALGAEELAGAARKLVVRGAEEESVSVAGRLAGKAKAVAEELTSEKVVVAEDMRDAVRLAEMFADDIVVVTGTLTILAECKRAFCASEFA